MDSASPWPVEEHWDRDSWLGFALEDEIRRPQSASLWLRATCGERRQRDARDEGQTK